MNRTRWFKKTLSLILAASLVATSPSLAFAAPKKKEVEAAPTKSYTVPYMIVLAMLGIGLMTVCRPSSRHDKPPEKIKEDEE
jgi:hypothetical protein